MHASNISADPEAKKTPAKSGMAELQLLYRLVAVIVHVLNIARMIKNNFTSKIYSLSTGVFVICRDFVRPRFCRTAQVLACPQSTTLQFPKGGNIFN